MHDFFLGVFISSLLWICAIGEIYLIQYEKKYGLDYLKDDPLTK